MNLYLSQTLRQIEAHFRDQPLMQRAGAAAADWAPVQHQGRLHDRASYRYYWELLERAHVTGMDIPAAARQRFLA